MKNFKDKVVVITGAGSGMGRAYACAFGDLGAKLVLNDFDQSALLATVRLLEEKGCLYIYSQAFDVADSKAMYAFAHSTKSVFGNAHIVINNAGIEGVNQPVWASAEQSYEQLMRVNFFGVMLGTKAFLPQLLENNEGAIVNVSSIFGLVGTPNSSDYCASKFAVRGFTESLMVELQNSPISVHLVHPGGIATNIAKIEEGQAFAHKYLSTPPEKIAQYLIHCIKKKKPKIVYGNGAFKTWTGANLVPQRVLSWMLWHELKSVINLKKLSTQLTQTLAFH